MSLTGGGGQNNRAEVINQGHVQIINFNNSGGAALSLTGGSGLSGGNEAAILNFGSGGGTSQQVLFNTVNDSGAINITGGTSGVGNNTGIYASSNQIIGSPTASSLPMPNITLTGGGEWRRCIRQR
jgi:hypothetical protein